MELYYAGRLLINREKVGYRFITLDYQEWIDIPLKQFEKLEKQTDGKKEFWVLSKNITLISRNGYGFWDLIERENGDFIDDYEYKCMRNGTHRTRVLDGYTLVSEEVITEAEKVVLEKTAKEIHKRVKNDDFCRTERCENNIRYCSSSAYYTFDVRIWSSYEGQQALYNVAYPLANAIEKAYSNVKVDVLVGDKDWFTVRFSKK